MLISAIWMICPGYGLLANAFGLALQILQRASVDCAQLVRISCPFGNSGACVRNSSGRLRCLGGLQKLRWQPMLALKGMPLGLGVGFRFGSQSPLWFSERFRVQDFLALGLPMDPSANLDIVSYETLAQIALVVVFSSACVGGRMRVTIPSWTDNSGTESICSKLFHDGYASGPFLRNVWLHLLGSLRCILMLRISLVSTIHLQTC